MGERDRKGWKSLTRLLITNKTTNRKKSDGRGERNGKGVTDERGWNYVGKTG